MNKQQPSETKEFVGYLKNGIWLFGISSWLEVIRKENLKSF
nr:hypothetical protein [Fischerella thermalis]